MTPRRRLDPASVEAFDAAGVDRLVINTVAARDADAVEERMRAAVGMIR